MATEDHSDVDGAARFAHLASTLVYLQEMLDMYTEADDMFIGLNRKTRERIEANAEDLKTNVMYALARTKSSVRREERLRLEEAIRNLTELLEDADFVPFIQFDRRDLQLILRFIDMVGMLRERSRRELAHFFDAVRANDIGYLVALTVPFRGNSKQKLETRFAHELPIEIRTALGLPKPPDRGPNPTDAD